MTHIAERVWWGTNLPEGEDGKKTLDDMSGTNRPR
jgi:hypothetical protein